MTGIDELMPTLASILSEQLINLNTQISKAGRCINDTDKKTERACSAACINTTTKSIVNNKGEEDCDGNDEMWRSWQTNTTRTTNLESQRQDILTKLNRVLNNEFKVLGEKQVLLAQLKTVGDNIDDNQEYLSKKIKKAKKEKQNNKKMLEIANYEYERFYEFKTMIKTIVYGLLVILLVMFLMKQPWFPTTIGVILISIVVAYLILTTLSRFFANMRRNDRSYSVINQTSKNHKYNNINMDVKSTSKVPYKKPATFGEMIFGTNSCDNFIGHKSIPYQSNFNNLKSFRT